MAGNATSEARATRATTPDGLVRLEEPVRLSESILWDLARTTRHGPSSLASSAVLARAWARTVHAFLSDMKLPHDADSPCYVVGLAADAGRLAHGFLQAWSELTRGDGPPICYLLTDVDESTVELWQRHPQLRELAEGGGLEFHCWDPEGGDEGPDLLANAAVRPPFVVIAGDAFAVLRHDAFAVLDGQLLECRLTLDAPAEAASPALDAVRVGHDYRHVGLPYYGDAILDGLLEEYRNELRTGHVLLPIGAFRAVRTLAELGGLLLLDASPGALHLEDLYEAPPPHPVHDGGLALPVNHHALGRWVEALGGRCFQPRSRPVHLAASAFILGVDGEVAATARALAEVLDGLGPDAVFTVERRLTQHLDEMSCREVLTYLKLAGWDTWAARRCLPRLRDLAEAGMTPGERDALADAAERIWAAHLHLGDPFDLAFELANVLETALLHRPAVALFHSSLERYGEHPATFFNLALAHARLGEDDLARRSVARVLELDPSNDSARALSRKLADSVEASHEDVPAAVKDAAPPAAYISNLEHLRGELAILNLRLRREVERWRRTHPPEASQEELGGSRLTDFGADVALDSLGDARELLAVPDADPLAALAPRIALHVQREEAALDAGVALRLPELAERLGLDDFERGVVLLALAPELDQRYERLFGYLGDDVERRWPTVALALHLLTAGPEESHAQAWKLGPHAPLSARRLVRIFEEEVPFPVSDRCRGLRLEARTLGFLLDRPAGALTADPVLAPFLEGHHADEPAMGDAEARAAIDELRTLLAGRPQPAPIVILDGPDVLLNRNVTAHLAGSEILVLRGAAVAAADPADLIARALREIELTGTALLVEDAAALRREGSPAEGLRQLLTAPCSRPRFLASAEAWPLPETCRGAPVLSLHVPVPDQAARRELWRRALGELAEGLDLAALAGRFRLTSAQIESAAVCVHTRLEGHRSKNLLHEIFTACRAQCFVSLDGLARRITSVHTWDDLVVPRSVKAKLRSIENWLSHRHVVHEEWGFAERVSVGRGMAAMFVGSSGTGKTMAAGVLGRVLDLDLYRIDLSSVVSKYIGETEKNLAKIFDAAEAANAILFFDEADALFGKRSEVKDAHDRHANIEVSYLLQRMENYDGIAILATNIKDNLDVAFSRRLQVIVEFPFPGVADCERIWRRLFSERVPLAEDVDFGGLARQFNLSGGSIKNCALDAALTAAAEAKPVEMRHLVQAVAREYEKLAKPVNAAAFGAWGHMLR